jgi:carboxymethylenebutenolidase
MDQRIIDLYDEYTHKPLSRSEFLRRLAHISGGAAAAAALLPLLEVDDARARTISPDDTRIGTEIITYKGATDMSAYLAWPQEGVKHPAVVIIHENRGLNEHIRDVARRVAVAGFLAIAPDALTPLGGAPEDQDKARSMMGELDRAQTLENFLASVTTAKSHPRSAGLVGCVGFCWGGAMANQLAVRSPDMTAAVAFYGRQPAAEDVSKIQGALLLHYAEKDQRINTGIPAYKEALEKEGVDYTIYMYEGVQHAFHNDTAPTRYNEEAAKLAWERTIAFLNKELR